MNKHTAKGLYVATTTPFKADGTINGTAIRTHADYLISCGISGLVPVGGTGEALALSFKERVEAVEATVDAVGGRVPVVAGVTLPGLRDAIALGRDFLSAGANSLMVLTPYGVLPTQEGIRDYYKGIADGVGQAILLYDIPYMTGTTIQPQTVRQIADDGSIFAMKASNPDQALFGELMRAVGGDIAIFAGDEDYFVEEVALGGVGGILASSAVLPCSWLEIFNLASAGNVADAKERLARLGDFIATVYSEPNPGPLKAALRIAGHDMGSVRTPLREPAAALIEQLQGQLATLLAYESELFQQRQ
ncbi:dihydrodipicolinate synthase family protein [Shinella sp. S4-D37]|uniref:dihydrodipicolinate synthase family protein n=1 Tax=Shinella sp. S4-D37 TaxID=3161999 RepID=UPI0034668E25